MNIHSQIFHQQHCLNFHLNYNFLVTTIIHYFIFSDLIIALIIFIIDFNHSFIINLYLFILANILVFVLNFNNFINFNIHIMAINFNQNYFANNFN